MSNFNLILTRPLFLLLLIPAAAVVLIPFFRLPVVRRRNWKRIVPVILRMTVCVLLVCLLAGLSFITQTDAQSVMILMDLSDSTRASHEAIVSYANDLMDQFEEKCGVIAFAGDTVYEVEFDSRGTDAHLAEVMAADTNISQALEYAASLLPNDSNRRIVLISDGKETSGDLSSAAASLASQGYRLDAIYLESSYLDNSEIQISNVTLPDNIYAGDTIDISVTVDSNVTASAELVLYNGKTELTRLPVSIKDGSNSFFLSTLVENPGVNAYRVELSGGTDTLSVNNSMVCYVKAAGESSVLIVADTLSRASQLNRILDPICDLHVVEAKDAPDTIIGLCDYDEIILVNVNADKLPAGFTGNISSYVADFGRSVLTVGGTGTYMYGSMKDTVYEEMMPVELYISEDQSDVTVALMLVMDCSGSMRRDISLAKQGAILSVNSLTEKNYVGLVSFNTYAHLRHPLVQATDKNKKAVVRTISSFATALGTNYNEALTIAFEELMKSRADSKHVIFLSDGEPSDSGYDVTVGRMVSHGISVSTISLGYTSEILANMADKGNGRYYYVRRAKDLPDIMLSEAKQVNVNSLLVGNFIPEISKESALTEGLEITSLPILGGYLGVTLKEEADEYIVSKDGNPVYAAWNYGMGTVASFMSDLDGHWSAEWLKSETGRLLVERMMTTTVGDTHSESTMTAEFEKGGSTTPVVVECLAPIQGGSVSLEVTSPDGEKAEYTLSEMGTGFYEGEITTPVTGIYEMRFVQTDGEGNTVDYLDTALAVSYSAEYDAFTDPGESLLEASCAYSGGMVSNDPAEIAAVEMDKVDDIRDPLIPIAFVCAAMLLFDLILRLLRLKDVKEFIRNLKSGRLKQS